MSRRRVLGTLGLTGAAWLLGSADGIAAPPQRGPIVKVPTSAGPALGGSSLLGRFDVPTEWAARNPGAYRYQRFISALGLKRIDPKQVIESHAKARSGVWNSIPPESMWRRMGYMLKVVERIAQEMNVSEVEIISAYRNPSYNARCRGAKSGSWHQENVAVDVRFPVRPSKVTAMARELRDLGLFRGGVGGYWNFTHIDCRGVNVNW